MQQQQQEQEQEQERAWGEEVMGNSNRTSMVCGWCGAVKKGLRMLSEETDSVKQVGADDLLDDLLEFFDHQVSRKGRAQRKRDP